MHLSDQFRARSVQRTYQSITLGCPSPPQGQVSTNIGRDSSDRKKMAAFPTGSSRCATMPPATTACLCICVYTCVSCVVVVLSVYYCFGAVLCGFASVCTYVSHVCSLCNSVLLHVCASRVVSRIFLHMYQRRLCHGQYRCPPLCVCASVCLCAAACVKITNFQVQYH